MRLKVLLCLIAVSNVQNAIALKPASDDDKEAIRTQIKKGKLMDSKVFAARDILLNTTIPKDSPEYLQLQRNVAREKDNQYAAYTKAIHMTMRAYDLVPVNRRGISVMPWTKGREIEWLPVANEGVARQVEDARGNFRETTRTPLDWGGRTFTDGVTYINPETIELGPEFIASTLLHERTHFEQHTTRGRGDAQTTAEGEVEAYRAEKENIDIFFGESGPKRESALIHVDAMIAQKQSQVDEQKAAQKGLRGILNRFRPPRNPDFSDSKLHTYAELNEIKKQSDDFEAALSEEDLRAASKAREHKKMAEREHDDRLREALIDIIARSCKNPGSVRQSELDNLPKPNDPIFYCVWSQGDCGSPEGLASCGTAYLTMGAAVGRGERLDAEVLRAATMPPPYAEVAKPVTPLPPAVTVVAEEPHPLWYALNDLRALALNACRSGGEARIDPKLTRPPVPYSFDRGTEDFRAAQLSVGLGDCERQLFMRLIEMIRDRQEAAISPQWLRDRVSEFSPRYAPPPSNGDPCRDNRNIRCP